MKTYSDKLKDPRWIVIKDRIIQRDIFCQVCGSSNNLKVHHKYYIEGKEPWEYDDNILVTLCEICHNSQHSTEISDILKQRLNSLTIDYIYLFSKSIIELYPLFITYFNSQDYKDKKAFLEYFTTLMKKHIESKHKDRVTSDPVF